MVPGSVLSELDRIEGISPLVPGPGSSSPAVPDILSSRLFGRLEEDNTDIAPATFAVLDAASVADLPELLNASGLEHECLFRGKAAEELSAAAPWLVRLEPENSFTRKLFTSGPAPWHLWGKISGSYLRFDGGCPELATHLRRFTRLPDEKAKWYYFRYWDPGVMAVVLKNPTERLAERILAPLSAVMTIFTDRGVALYRQRYDAFAGRGNAPIQLTSQFRELLTAAAESRFDEKLRRYLARNDQKFSRLPYSDQLARTKEAVVAAEFYGFRIEAAVARFARVYLVIPRGDFASQDVRDITTSARHELDRVNDLARYFRIGL